MPVDPIPFVLPSLALIAASIAICVYRRGYRHWLAPALCAIGLLAAFFGLYFVPVWIAAASARTSDEQYRVGRLYCSRGSYNFPNHAAAAYWYERAAEGGHACAQFEIGMAYLQGWGVHVDKRRAYEWLKRSLANGDERADPYLKTLSRELGP